MWRWPCEHTSEREKEKKGHCEKRRILQFMRRLNYVSSNYLNFREDFSCTFFAFILLIFFLLRLIIEDILRP